jgi:hypothetical protein
MPALPTVTKTIKVSLGFDLDAGLSGSRFFISYTGGPPVSADLVTFAGAVAASFNTRLCPQMANQFSLISVGATDLDSSLGSFGEWTGSHSGTLGTSLNPAQCCVVIDFKIARRYRGGKPRIYLPLGDNNELTTAQLWASGFVTTVDGAWGALITDIQALSYGSFTPAYHVNAAYYKGVYTTSPPWRGPGYKYPPKPVAGPVSPDIITTHAVRQVVGTQRRRLTAPT